MKFDFLRKLFNRTEVLANPDQFRTKGPDEWSISGALYRTDDPAVENADGTKTWSRDGKHLVDGDRNGPFEKPPVLK